MEDETNVTEAAVIKDEVTEVPPTVIDMEIEALKAIFINELEVIQTESSGHVLTLNLEPATADNKEACYVCLTLHISVPENYPDELPTIVIKNPRGLSDEGLNRIMTDIGAKSSQMRGNQMLFELIDVAKEYLTFWNMPSCQCAICLNGFSQDDVFTKTECYHYFHSHCLAKFVNYSKEQFEENPPFGIEHSGMNPQKFQAECPICRLAINFECDVNFPAPSAAAAADEPFEISEDIKEIQEKLASLYENQKAKGGIIDLEEERKRFMIEISTVPSTRITLSTESQSEDEETVNTNSPKRKPQVKNSQYLKEKLRTKQSAAVKNDSQDGGGGENETEDHPEDVNADKDVKKSPKEKVRTNNHQDRRPNNNYNNRGRYRGGGGGYNNYNDNYRRPQRGGSGGYNQYNNRDNWYGNNRRNYNRYPNNRDYNDYYDGGRPHRGSNQNRDNRRPRQDSEPSKKTQTHLNGDTDTQEMHLNGTQQQDEQNDDSNVAIATGKPSGNKKGSNRDQRPRNNPNPRNRQRDDYRSRKESVNSNHTEKDTKDFAENNEDVASPKLVERMTRSSPNRRNRYNSKNSNHSTEVDVVEVARNVDTLNSSPPQTDEGNNRKSGGGRGGGRNFRRGSNKSKATKSSSKDGGSGNNSMLNSLNKDFEEFVSEFKEEEPPQKQQQQKQQQPSTQNGNGCDQNSGEKSSPEDADAAGNDFAKSHEENRTISNQRGKHNERGPPRNNNNYRSPPQQNRYNGYNGNRGGGGGGGGRQQYPRQSRSGNYRRPGNYDYQDRDSYNSSYNRAGGGGPGAGGVGGGNYNSYNRVPNNYNNYGPRSYRNGDSRGPSGGAEGGGGGGYQHTQSSRQNMMDKPRPNLSNVAGYNRDANSPKIRHPEAQFHPPGIPVMKPVVTNQSE